MSFDINKLEKLPGMIDKDSLLKEIDLTKNIIGTNIPSNNNFEESTKSLTKQFKQKEEREEKKVENIETTRDLVQEFKDIVQEFIVASEAQTRAAEDNNRVIKNWTTRIGWLTLAMFVFAAATLYFTYLTYIS